MMSIIKKTFLVIIVLFSVFNANSQESKFSIGAKAGINFSNVDMELDPDTKVGYQFGVVAEYNLLKKFFLRSGLDITSKGFKWNLSKIVGDINGDGLLDYAQAKSSWNAVYLQVPLMLGYKINITNALKINFALGGYLAHGVGGKVTSKLDGALGIPAEQFEFFRTEDKDNTFSDDFLLRFDGGLIGSVGAEYRSFTLNVGYEHGLNNVYQGAGGSIHNRNIFLAVGYRIF